MYSTFAPPNEDEYARIQRVHRAVRVLDANGGCIASDDLPVCNPHGVPWALMTDEQLEVAKTWCMLPEMHDALQKQLCIRRDRSFG